MAILNDASGLGITDAERQQFLQQNNLSPDMGSYIQRNSLGYLFLPHDQFTGAVLNPQQFQQSLVPPTVTQAQQDASQAAFRANGGMTVPKVTDFSPTGQPLAPGSIPGAPPPPTYVNPGSFQSQPGFTNPGSFTSGPAPTLGAPAPTALPTFDNMQMFAASGAPMPSFNYSPQGPAPVGGVEFQNPLSPVANGPGLPNNGQQLVQWGENAPRYSDTLRMLMNYALQQSNYGQNAILGALGPLNNFAGSIGGQYNDAQALAQSFANQLPGVANFAGGQAQGTAGTRDALLNALINQGIDPQTAAALTSSGGLSQNAANTLNQFAPLLQPALQSLLNPASNSTLNAAMNLFGTGLDPATQAALQTQAMDTTAQQYNNAKQGVMTQLLNSGALGQGDIPGAMGQIVNELGPLANAQQQQQSQLQQQAILANQEALGQNRQLALQAVNQLLGTQLGAFGQGANFAQGLTGLQQQAAENMGQMSQQALLANRGLGLQGANIFGNQSLGYGNQLQDLLGMGLNYPLPYMNAYSGLLNNLLGGSQALGNMGLQGFGALSPLLGAYTALSTAPSTGGQILNSLIGGGLSLLPKLL